MFHQLTLASTLALVLLAAACDDKTKAPATTTDVTAPPGLCGMKTSDWCPSPAGDPCGKHPNVAECRADKACKGMPYSGESVVACKDDGTGFASNCPTVGCISR